MSESPQNSELVKQIEDACRLLKQHGFMVLKTDEMDEAVIRTLIAVLNAAGGSVAVPQRNFATAGEYVLVSDWDMENGKLILSTERNA